MGNTVQTLKATNWKATIATLLLRAVSGSVAWGCFTFCLIITGEMMGNPISGFFAMFIGMFMMALIFLPIALAASALSRIGIPFAGLFTLPAVFIVLPGDPFLFIVDKFTGIVPMKDFKFINFTFMILVLNDESLLVDDAESEVVIDEDKPCPHMGKIVITTKDGAGALGFTWDSQEITMEIREDWRIYKHIVGEVIGFVDEEGGLHKGGLDFFDGSANPKATFSGDLFARIHGEAIFDLNHNKIADFWPKRF